MYLSLDVKVVVFLNPLLNMLSKAMYCAKPKRIESKANKVNRHNPNNDRPLHEICSCIFVRLKIKNNAEASNRIVFLNDPHHEKTCALHIC